jgi:hypothetical protein
VCGGRGGVCGATGGRGPDHVGASVGSYPTHASTRSGDPPTRLRGE